MVQDEERSIKVHLVAPQLVRWGMERLIQSAMPALEVAGASDSVAQSLGALEREPADVVVVDVDAESDGRLSALLCATPGIKVLLVTAAQDSAGVDEAILAGARGVVHKRASPLMLLKAIERVFEGELWLDRGTTGRIFLELARQRPRAQADDDHLKIAALTSRERQTIAVLASDSSASGKLIAGRLCISEHTLRNHLTSIYRKLGLTSRVDLYAYAHKHALHRAA